MCTCIFILPTKLWCILMLVAVQIHQQKP